MTAPQLLLLLLAGVYDSDRCKLLVPADGCAGNATESDPPFEGLVDEDEGVAATAPVVVAS